MVEADFQGIFKTWLELNPPDFSFAFELKICKGKSIGFNHVSVGQVSKLQQVKKRGLCHKIADAPFGHSEGFRFHTVKPFDGMFIRGVAYVIVLFYEPRRLKTMVWIDVDDFVRERDSSERKSLTLERAKLIGSKIIAL